MNIMISESDKPIVARLKLLYLVPVFLITLVPICLWVGFREYGFDGLKMTLHILRTGKCC